jgi:hypothetical protein
MPIPADHFIAQRGGCEQAFGVTAMADLKNPGLIYLKGALFLVLGLTASALLLLEHPGVRTAALLALTIWAFARAYYFAFYVVQHYVDSSFRFAGLLHFVRYLLRGRSAAGTTNRPQC